LIEEKIEDIPKYVFPSLIEKEYCWLSMDTTVGFKCIEQRQQIFGYRYHRQRKL